MNLFGLIYLKYWILGLLAYYLFLFGYYIIRYGWKPWPIKLRNIDGIPSFTRYLEYYSWLLPKFLFNLGLFFIILSVFNIYCVLIVIISLVLSIIILFILNSIKNEYNSNLYYQINRAYNMLEDYLLDDEKDNIFINEFNKYFKNSINLINNRLLPGVKLDDLNTKNNDSPKNFIPYYLPAYIQYNNKDQLESLRDHIYLILKLIPKNNNISLKITTPLSNISRDIELFLFRNNYSTSEKKWDINIPFWAKIFDISSVSIKSNRRGSENENLLKWFLFIVGIIYLISGISYLISEISRIISLIK